MERADQGADEAARLDAGGQRRQHVQSHRPPDPRDEHNTALPQGILLTLKAARFILY